jgi:hypothetical protein
MNPDGSVTAPRRGLLAWREDLPPDSPNPYSTSEFT